MEKWPFGNAYQGSTSLCVMVCHHRDQKACTAPPSGGPKVMTHRSTIGVGHPCSVDRGHPAGPEHGMCVGTIKGDQNGIETGRTEGPQHTVESWSPDGDAWNSLPDRGPPPNHTAACLSQRPEPSLLLRCLQTASECLSMTCKTALTNTLIYMHSHAHTHTLLIFPFNTDQLLVPKYPSCSLPLGLCLCCVPGKNSPLSSSSCQKPTRSSRPIPSTSPSLLYPLTWNESFFSQTFQRTPLTLHF